MSYTHQLAKHIEIVFILELQASLVMLSRDNSSRHCHTI